MTEKHCLTCAFVDEDLQQKINEINAQIMGMYSAGGRECPICGGNLPENYVCTNRDWLFTLPPVELVGWIKNTASAMSDAELLKWMEEKHEAD